MESKNEPHSLCYAFYSALWIDPGIEAGERSHSLCPGQDIPQVKPWPEATMSGSLPALQTDQLPQALESLLKFKVHVCMLSCFSPVQLFVTPWTIAHQARPWNSPGKNTGVGCRVPLGNFPIKGSNLCLSRLSCIGRWVLYY